MIIGLSAKAGCGKTTLANLLLERLPGFVRLAFADVLKEECARVFGFPLEWCYSEEGKASQVNMVPWCEHGEWGFPDFKAPAPVMTVREILQWYGTDVCRARDPLHWTKAWVGRWMEKKCPDVLVDDVRFPDEAALIRGMGGIMVRLDPYPGWQPGPHAGHVSETALDGWEGFDLRLAPEFGKLDEAAFTVDWAARRMVETGPCRCGIMSLCQQAFDRRKELGQAA